VGGWINGIVLTSARELLKFISKTEKGLNISYTFLRF